ncbi:calcium-binding protein [Actinoplanes sp. CA-051413]|uniref:calcium-binding protein n=1 Tax=Actinoplanes sp. CA-051413 TaxID=3239899 RepID=UPI003D9855CB
MPFIDVTAAYAEKQTPVTADLDGSVGDDGTVGEGDTIGADVERLLGGNGADTLTGNDADNRIYGSFGPDTIHGGTGNDELHGGTGNDIILGQNGSDQLFGDDGDDYLIGEPGAGPPVAGETPGSDSETDTVDGGRNVTAAPGDSCFVRAAATSARCETTLTATP